MVHISTAQESYPSMSSPHIFDTLAFAKKLKAAGVPDLQAEAHAEAMLGVIETDLSTKYDIYEIKREIKSVEYEVKQEIKTLETELKRETKKLGTEIKNLESEVKRDINLLESEVKRETKKLELEIKKLEISLKKDMKELEEKLSYKLTVRLGAMLVTGVTVLAILIKLI